MKKQTYSIQSAIEAVAESLAGSDDHSATTIRCTINDTLDAADKDGFAVNHGYDQKRAVQKVKRILGDN